MEENQKHKNANVQKCDFAPLTLFKIAKTHFYVFVQKCFCVPIVIKKYMRMTKLQIFHTLLKFGYFGNFSTKMPSVRQSWTSPVQK
jgi:hypothetical protein